MSLIQVNQIEKSFHEQKVLRGISFSFESGEHYVIKGASGSGKSTLLYLLGGLDRADRGEVVVNNKVLSQLNDTELASYRNQVVGFIFQFHFLLSSMSCWQNILLPAKIANAPLGEMKKSLKELAQHLGVSHCLNKYPHQLSGGEQQRINIIRALSLKPKVLLCDEPTGNLDSVNSQKVIQLIRKLAREFSATLIVVTHDEKIAADFNHKITIEDGRLIG